ncbi:hypothetical protein [Burkholderia sp. NLJ2]|uniref:hypothetical protein n=1 Tax=Burkholderia sp. NLJ2 TaxID=3090699 RepID=UPI003C6C3495
MVFHPAPAACRIFSSTDRDIPHTVELAGAIVFGFALLLTFLAKRFEVLAHRHPRDVGLFPLND